MKFRTSHISGTEINLPEYDYQKIKKELEERSEEYKKRSQELEELRSQRISPFSGLEVEGDALVGRPTLTEEAPVFWYRSLVHNGMRNHLRKLVGDEIDAYLYKAGTEMGKELVKKEFIAEKEDLEEQKKEVAEKIKEAKIGIVQFLSFEEDYARVRVDECVSCAGQADIGEMVCFWEGGVLSGIISSLFRVSAEALEYKCWGNGDETCEFEIFIGEDASERFEKRYRELARNKG